MFGGVLQSQVRCLSCNTESNKLDEIMDLSLDIVRMNTVGDALCRFFQPEVLDGDNKYRCDRCKKLCPARKQMAVYRAPNVLVIQLKRFENIYGGKIDRHVVFEERLCLTGHMCRASKDTRPEYSLYGIVVHVGHSQDAGHYYAYVKDSSGRWFCCDDASVSAVINTKTVLDEKAYMLFYVRSSMGMKTSKESLASVGSMPLSRAIHETQLTKSPKMNAPVSKNSGFGVSNNGNLSRATAKPALKICSVPAVNGRRVKFGHLGNGSHCKPEELANGKAVIEEQISTNGDCRSSGLSPHEEISSVGTECNARFYGPELPETLASSSPEDTRTTHLAEPAVPPVPLSTSIDSSAVSALPKFTSNNPIGDKSVVTVKDAFVSGGTNSCAMEIRETDCRSRLVQSEQEKDGSEEANFCQKRVREEGGISLLEVNKAEEVSGAALSVDVNEKNSLKDADQLTELEKLKIILEKEGRAELQRSGWCEALRESLRAAKKRRLGQLWPRETADRALLRKQLIIEVQEPLKLQVPRALKEHLVEQLRTFFYRKTTKLELVLKQFLI